MVVVLFLLNKPNELFNRPNLWIDMKINLKWKKKITYVGLNYSIRNIFSLYNPHFFSSLSCVLWRLSTEFLLVIHSPHDFKSAFYLLSFRVSSFCRFFFFICMSVSSFKQIIKGLPTRWRWYYQEFKKKKKDSKNKNLKMTDTFPRNKIFLWSILVNTKFQQ